MTGGPQRKGNPGDGALVSEERTNFVLEEMRLVPTMTASACSGALARVPCYPIDTIKARLQTQTWVSGSSTVYRNFLHGLQDAWRFEGLRGLYRGLWPTMLGSMPASCLYFTSYELVKDRLAGDQNQFAVHMIGGMVAETVSCVLWVPIDVVKERMQIQHVTRDANLSEMKRAGGDAFYLNGRDALASIWRQEGIAGFYRGYGATVMSFGPFSALYFSFYEQLKSTLQPKHGEAPFGTLLVCGAVAGAGASFCTNPLDMVKLRLQVQRHQESPDVKRGSQHLQGERYNNSIDGLRKLFRGEGFRGLFRGAGARMAFHAPATAVNMALFEKFKVITYGL